MSSIVLTKNYRAPAVCKKEILRYAGCKQATQDINLLLDECLKEAEGVLTYKVCYCLLDTEINDDVCRLESLFVKSKSLAKNLLECKRTVLFAATVGIGIDRLIAKYSRIAPTKALLMQAIGSERVEALCDAFCEETAKEYGGCVRPRFSPGYADLSLELQRDVVDLLDCAKWLGISLNDSLLMSPSKSVTAFLGIKGEEV